MLSASMGRLRLPLRYLCFVIPVFAGGAMAADPPIAIALHGGAGTIERGAMSEELEATYRAFLDDAITQAVFRSRRVALIGRRNRRRRRNLCRLSHRAVAR